MVGKNIKNYRIRKGISIEDLALAIGLDKQELSAIEKEKRDLTTTQLMKIADSLDIPVYMFFWDEKKKKGLPREIINMEKILIKLATSNISVENSIQKPKIAITS